MHKLDIRDWESIMSTMRKILRRSRNLVDVVRNTIGWHQSQATLTRDAQMFWNEPPPNIRYLYSHWRNAFENDATWLAIGAESLRVFETFSRSAQFIGPVRRAVEWGCGGGANAIHYGRICDEFYGVDITQASLDECGRQMSAEGLTNSRPVLVEAAQPQTALASIPNDCDLFVSFYVFEVFPSPEYGIDILRIAHSLLRPGGMAIIHIKYPTGLTTRSRRWGYRFGAASMTSYRVDEFWEHAKECGFHCHAVSLVPKQPLVNDERYAYVVLLKPSS